MLEDFLILHAVSSFLRSPPQTYRHSLLHLCVKHSSLLKASVSFSFLFYTLSLCYFFSCSHVPLCLQSGVFLTQFVVRFKSGRSAEERIHLIPHTIFFMTSVSVHMLDLQKRFLMNRKLLVTGLAFQKSDFD